MSQTEELGLPGVPGRLEGPGVSTRGKATRVSPARLLGWGILGPAAVLTGGLILLPLAYLVLTSLSTDGNPGTGLTLDNYVTAFRSDRLVRLLLNSALYAAGVCGVAVMVGGTLAWVSERTNAPLRGWLLPIALLPLGIPGVLFTLSWILLLSPRIGLINKIATSILPLDSFLNIYSLYGMVLVEGVQASSLAYLMIAGYLRSVDTSLEEAARVAGAGIGRTVRRVTLPLGLPTVLGVLLLIFVRAIESFETPALIGIPARIPVFTSQIFLAIRDLPPDFGLGSAFSMILIAITTLGVILYGRLLNRGRQFATIGGKDSATTRLDLGKWRWPVTVAVLSYAGLVLVLPIGILVWVSLLPSYLTPSMEALSQVSLDNYRNIIGRPDFRKAATNTAILAVSSSLIVSVIAVTLSWVVVRVRARGVWAIDSIATVPVVIPGIVMGMAFLTLALNVPISLYGTLAILLMVYVTRFLPYGMRAATAGLIQIDPELEEAGIVSGANWFRRMRKIVVPLVLPALAGSFIYVALLSVRELSASIMVYSVKTEVFSIVIFDYWQNGEFGLLAAAGILTILVLTLFVLVLRRLGIIGVRGI